MSSRPVRRTGRRKKVREYNKSGTNNTLQARRMKNIK